MKLDLSEDLKSHNAYCITDPDGARQISTLKNLRSLELTYCVEENGLREQDMIAMFNNYNMANLGLLSLSGFEPSIITNELVKVIADNCPKLYYFNIYKAQFINNDCIGYLIKKHATLKYLSVCKCYNLDPEFMYEAVKSSPSRKLKINTYQGIIVWNKSKEKVFLDSSGSLWNTTIEM